jgi:hypothetical protein
MGIKGIKLFVWGEGDSGGHVLRKTTSRGLCGLVCPSHTANINYKAVREVVCIYYCRT